MDPLSGLGPWRSTAPFLAQGHDRGVNCLDYYPGGEVLCFSLQLTRAFTGDKHI